MSNPKKDIFLAQAEILFVEQSHTITDIVQVLCGNVSEKTLHKWKKAGQWEEKRAAFVQSKTVEYKEDLKLNDKLYRITNYLADNIIGDISQKKAASIEEIRILTRLVAILRPSKTYDEEKGKTEQKAKQKLTLEELAAIEKEVFGI